MKNNTFPFAETPKKARDQNFKLAKYQVAVFVVIRNLIIPDIALAKCQRVTIQNKYIHYKQILPFSTIRSRLPERLYVLISTYVCRPSPKRNLSRKVKLYVAS